MAENPRCERSEDIPTSEAGTRCSTPAAPPVEAPKKYKITPLPLRQMVPMAFVLLSDSLCATILSPFVGLFIAHLENRPPDEAGYLSGLLLAMFMIGQVASAKTWGWISDQYGRRLPLICGLLSSGFMMLFFGLSTSVWQCAFFRFLQGIFNGNILVAKTMMADITDKTNETQGFSFVSFCFGFGNLIGPGLGGLLYDPAHSSTMSWMHLDPDGAFGRHPALLPCLLIFIYSNIGMLVCTFFVQESNPHAKPFPVIVQRILPCLWREPEKFVHPPLIEVDDDGQEVVIVEVVPPDSGHPRTPKEEDQRAPEEREELASNESHELSPLDQHEDKAVPSSETPIMDGEGAAVEAEKKESTSFGYKQAFSMPVTRYMLITYMVMCGSDSIARECLPLWAISSASKGGLNLGSDKVGFILLMNSLPLFAANFTFSFACAKYGDKMALFRLGVFCAGIAVFFLPLTTYYAAGAFLIFCVLVSTSARQFFCTWSYSLNTLFTARAAPPGKVGAIMGINQSCGAVTRAIIPLMSTPIFAWSISGNNIFPFNHVLVFFISTMGFWYCALRSYEVRSNSASTTLQLVDVNVKEIFLEKWRRAKSLVGISSGEN